MGNDHFHITMSLVWDTVIFWPQAPSNSVVADRGYQRRKAYEIQPLFDALWANVHLICLDWLTGIFPAVLISGGSLVENEGATFASCTFRALYMRHGYECQRRLFKGVHLSWIGVWRTQRKPFTCRIQFVESHAPPHRPRPSWAYLFTPFTVTLSFWTWSIRNHFAGNRCSTPSSQDTRWRTVWRDRDVTVRPSLRHNWTRYIGYGVMKVSISNCRSFVDWRRRNVGRSKFPKSDAANRSHAFRLSVYLNWSSPVGRELCIHYDVCGRMAPFWTKPTSCFACDIITG